MPKKLKTLERNEGKAPLLVPRPEEEDHALQTAIPQILPVQTVARIQTPDSSQTGSSTRMKIFAPTLENTYITSRNADCTNQDTWYDECDIQVFCAKHHNKLQGRINGLARS